MWGGGSDGMPMRGLFWEKAQVAASCGEAQEEGQAIAIHLPLTRAIFFQAPTLTLDVLGLSLGPLSGGEAGFPPCLCFGAGHEHGTEALQFSSSTRIQQGVCCAPAERCPNGNRLCHGPLYQSSGGKSKWVSKSSTRRSAIFSSSGPSTSICTMQSWRSSRERICRTEDKSQSPFSFQTRIRPP